MSDAPSSSDMPPASDTPKSASATSSPPTAGYAPGPPPPAEPSERNRVIGLCVLALLMFGFYFWEQSGNDALMFANPVGEARMYNNAAKLVAAGASAAVPDLPPLYVHFLAAVDKISGSSVLAAKCVNAVLGMLTCLLTWSLARKLFDAGVAAAAAALTIYWGPLMCLSSELTPVALTVFLCTLSLWLLIWALGRHVWWAWLVTGLSLGLTATASPSILWFVLAVVIGLAISAIPRRSSARLAGSGLVLVGVALMIAPVMIRNARVFDRFALTPRGSGLQLYVGNNPDAFETIATRPGTAWNDLAAEPLMHGAYTSKEQNRYFYGQVADYARSEPGSFVRGLLRKTHLFFAGRETPLRSDVYTIGAASSLMRWMTVKIGPIRLPFGLIAPFAMLGIVVAWQRNRLSRILTGYLIVSAAAVILFYVAAPYRLPIVPVVCIFAAFSFTWLREQMGQGNARAAASGLVLVLATGVVVNWPVKAPADEVKFRTEMFVDLARQAISAKQPEDAKDILEKVVQDNKDCADAFYLLGMIQIEGKLRTDAIDQFNRALAIDPDLAGAHIELARIAIREQRWADAERSLRAAIKARPLGHVLEATPPQRDPWILLTQTLLQQKMLNDAVATMQEAVELIPVYAPYRREMVRLLMLSGNLDALKAELESAVGIIPRDPQLHFWLGGILANNPDTVLSGLQHLQTAVSLDPKNIGYRLGLANLLGFMGRSTAAQQAIDDARQIAQQTGKGLDLVNQAEAYQREIAERIATQTAPGATLTPTATMPSSPPPPDSPTHSTE